MTRDPAVSIGLPLLGLAVAIGLWWALTVVFAIPPFLLPSPVAVVARLAGNPDLYLTNAVQTLYKILIGGATGIAVGFALALLVWAIPLLERAIYPYLVAARVLPKIAIAPIFLIYFGVGFDTAIIFVAVIVFFPVVVGTATGLDRTPESHLDLLRSVDASAIQTFLAVRLPHALPDVFAGVKQSVTLAVVGAVVAEWILSNDGLGSLILVASENVQVDVMLAALTVLLAMGLCLYGGVALCYRVVAWQ